MELVGNPQYPVLRRVSAVKFLSGFRVHLTFADGLEKDVDLEAHFAPPHDAPSESAFAQAHGQKENASAHIARPRIISALDVLRGIIPP